MNKATIPTRPNLSGVCRFFLVPAIVLSFLFAPLQSAHAADTLRTEVGPGMTFIHIHDLSIPLHIVALEVDVTEPTTKITTVLSNDGLGTSNELVKNMARRNTGDGHLVIGAINGDFWDTSPPPGGFAYRLRNGQIMNGEYVFGGHRSSRNSFGMTADGIPVVDRITFTGHIDLEGDIRLPLAGLNNEPASDGLVIYNRFTGPNTRSDSTATEWALLPVSDMAVNQPVTFEVTEIQRFAGNMAIPQDQYVLSGGGAIADSLFGLLSVGDQLEVTMGAASHTDGDLVNQVVTELIAGNQRLLNDGVRSTSDGDRHPRTAVGISKDTTKVYFVVVDGRQHYSRGASLAEMGRVMEDLGAWNAVNLDGGGSSTLVVRDDYKNNHDLGFGLGTYRSVVNGLMAVAEVRYEDIAQNLELSPKEAVVDTAEAAGFSASLIDLWGYGLPDAGDDVTWELIGLDGEISADGQFTAHDYGSGHVVAHFGAFSDTASVEVREPVGVEPIGPGVPESFVLNQNYPNPFNPDTRITFELPVASHVRVTVYDILGRPVAVLADEQHMPGVHAVRFDAGRLSSGTYIYEVVAGDFTARRTMMLIK